MYMVLYKKMVLDKKKPRKSKKYKRLKFFGGQTYEISAD
jgi:hypothetical protein